MYVCMYWTTFVYCHVMSLGLYIVNFPQYDFSVTSAMSVAT